MKEHGLSCPAIIVVGDIFAGSVAWSRREQALVDAARFRDARSQMAEYGRETWR